MVMVVVVLVGSSRSAHCVSAALRRALAGKNDRCSNEDDK